MKRSFISIFMSVAAISAFGWGQKGHDVTAFIAENHLTPTTRAAVDSLLEGRSMVYWANWLDNASHTPKYAYTKTWHYKTSMKANAMKKPKPTHREMQSLPSRPRLKPSPAKILL